MSNKKSRRNQPQTNRTKSSQGESNTGQSNTGQSNTGQSKDDQSRSKAAGSLPNRPPSTGLLRIDDSSPDTDTFDDDDGLDDANLDVEPDDVEIDFAEIADVDEADTAGGNDPIDSATAPVGDPEAKAAATQRPARRAPVATARRTDRTSSRTAVVADAVAKTYGDLPALAPLDLTVSTGERVALIGHNGSGKTTFIKMLCGLLEPTDGSIEVFGHEPGSMPARRAVSYLSDQPVFYEDLSLVEHIEYVARLHDVDDWTGLGEELLERFRLTDRRDDLPVTFSRGLKQKASICLAFVRPFDLLVVDEPFVGLDTLGRTELLALMAEHHEQGATLIVATHELNTVAASDRIVALRSGEVAYDDAVDASRDVDLDSLVDDAG